MKIGLLTLPVETGYGSILQAVALKTKLVDLGHDVTLIRRQVERKDSFLRITVRTIKKYIFRKPIIVQISKKYRDEFPIITKYTQPFIDKHLSPYTEFYYSSKSMKKINKLGFDAIVVGSDQVSRPGYVQNVADFFLYQIDNNIKKYSYAASFGTDEWLFTEKETSICRDAIKYFLKISIRESSTIDLCYDKLGKKPEFVLDPTLLLDNKFYSGLIEKHESYREGKLCAYILNKKSLMPIVETYSKILDTSSVFPHSEVEDVSAPLDLRVVPSVSDWLDSIRSSQAVCTDSFHGMAFSIIFRKPFIVVVNKERGAARFFSLLNALNLEHRIVDESTDLNDLKPIDWGDVEDRLAKMQGQSIQFLKSIQ